MATGVVDAMEKNEAGFELGEKYGGVEMTTLNIGLFMLSQLSYGGVAAPSLETRNPFCWVLDDPLWRLMSSEVSVVWYGWVGWGVCVPKAIVFMGGGSGVATLPISRMASPTSAAICPPPHT